MEPSKEKTTIVRRHPCEQGLELGTDWQAMEAAVVAPGTQRTLDMLQDTSPRQPRAAVLGHIAQLQPDKLFYLDQFKFREAAAGPSGMTTEYLKPMLESGVVIQHLDDVASGLARGEVPPEVVDAFKMGRMTANPEG